MCGYAGCNGCGACGKKVPQIAVAVCMKCGAPVPPDNRSNTCKQCGFPLVIKPGTNSQEKL